MIEFQMGTVTQAAPLLVRAGNASATATGMPCTRLAAYAPVLGHRVLIIIQGADRCVLGQVV